MEVEFPHINQLKETEISQGIRKKIQCSLDPGKVWTVTFFSNLSRSFSKLVRQQGHDSAASEEGDNS